jgi:hypothetical protein
VSGGIHHWFKRSTRKKGPVTGENNNIIIIIIIVFVLRGLFQVHFIDED